MYGLLPSLSFVPLDRPFWIRRTVYFDPNRKIDNLQSSHSTNITVGGMRPTTKSHLLTKLIKLSVCSTSDFSTWLSSSIDASKVSLSSSSRENTELTNPGRNLYLSYKIFDQPKSCHQHISSPAFVTHIGVL